MKYILDTNAISLLMREDAPMLVWLASVREDDRIVLCPISRGEILYGVRRLAVGRRRDWLEAKAQEIFSVLQSEPIPIRAGDLYAEIKIACQSRGLVLDENDLWIAASAMVLGATLVTRDSDFSGIEALSVIRP